MARPPSWAKRIVLPPLGRFRLSSDVGACMAHHFKQKEGFILCSDELTEALNPCLEVKTARVVLGVWLFPVSYEEGVCSGLS